MMNKKALMLVVCGTAAIIAGHGIAVAAETADSVKAKLDFGGAAFDSSLTDQARIFAGMVPLDKNRFKHLTSTKAWQEHRRQFESSWARLDERLRAMSQWRETELSGIASADATLFYPFSGPDFLNADVFFPDFEKSVYLSLESTGEIPSPDKDTAIFANYFEDIRASLSNMFARAFFVTSRMMTQLHTPYLKGNLTIFMVFLARRECAIVSINRVRIDSAGALVTVANDSGRSVKGGVKGVEIQYVKARSNGSIRHLFYFPINICDSALALKPQFQTYLHSLGTTITFTKAASYCMHDKNFSIIRTVSLNARAVLEDDSGIPYKYFPDSLWNVTLYGKYTKPVADFNYGFQTDLDRAFVSGKNVKPLPFNIGYHWNDGYSNLILAIRK
jgi:hypothetical protein